MVHNFHSWKSNQGVTVLVGCWDNPLGLTELAAGGGPLPSALPSPAPRDRQLKSLVSGARWITPGLPGSAMYYIGTKNQSLSSDVPTHPSHHDPKNQTTFCPNSQPLQQGHFEWIPPPAVSTPLTLLWCFTPAEPFSKCPCG